MKHLTIFVSLFFMISAAVTAFAGQSRTNTSNLVINITGFENSKGAAKVAVVNSKKNFDSKTPFKGYNFNIINNRVNNTITLPYGEYAVKVYHDENGNNELDTRIFGIPKERYGFSNNARGTMGPPEYEEALFNLNSPEKKIFITLE